MNKQTIYLILSVFFLTFFATTAYYQSHSSVVYKLIPGDQQTITNNPTIDPRFFLLSDLTTRFASEHTFVENTYDCDNYSQDYADLLNKNGFDAKVVRGCEFNGITTYCHAWNTITLQIEPQKGDFFSGNDKTYNASGWECGVFDNKTGCRKRIQ